MRARHLVQCWVRTVLSKRYTPGVKLIIGQRVQGFDSRRLIDDKHAPILPLILRFRIRSGCRLVRRRIRGAAFDARYIAV